MYQDNSDKNAIPGICGRSRTNILELHLQESDYMFLKFFSVVSFIVLAIQSLLVFFFGIDTIQTAQLRGAARAQGEMVLIPLFLGVGISILYLAFHIVMRLVARYKGYDVPSRISWIGAICFFLPFVFFLVFGAILR